MRSNQFACVLSITSLLVWPLAARAEDGALRDTIDREIKAGWAKEKITPPQRSADHVFLRRVYLDLIGTIPSYEEATAFLNDADPKRREKLVDKLLADPRNPQNQAQVWDVALLGRSPRNVGSHRNREVLRTWLAAQFEKNEPYDRFVANLLTAEADGPQLFYLANRSADEMTTAATRLFLGVQIQCAKCHDHPFEPWTQKDYYGMTGFFVRTFVAEVGKDKDKKYFVGEKSTGDVLFTATQDPKKSGAKGDPVKPKFLNGAELNEPPVPKVFVEP